MACANNNVPILELLMKHRGDPNIVPTDKFKRTSMMKAGFEGNIDALNIILNVNGQYDKSFDWVCIMYLLIYYIYVCTYNPLYLPESLSMLELVF